jgi:hypothetical protein
MVASRFLTAVYPLRSRHEKCHVKVKEGAPVMQKICVKI